MSGFRDCFLYVLWVKFLESLIPMNNFHPWMAGTCIGCCHNLTTSTYHQWLHHPWMAGTSILSCHTSPGVFATNGDTRQLLGHAIAYTSHHQSSATNGHTRRVLGHAIATGSAALRIGRRCLARPSSFKTVTPAIYGQAPPLVVKRGGG